MSKEKMRKLGKLNPVSAFFMWYNEAYSFKPPPKAL